MGKKLLIFHPAIAPYRIDYFNSLSKHYDVKVVLYWRNLKDQTFDYKKIEDQLLFQPNYIVKEELGVIGWAKALWRQLNLFKPDIVMVMEYGLGTIIPIINRVLCGQKFKLVIMTDDSYNILTCDNHFSKRHKWGIKYIAPFVDEIVNVEPNSSRWYQERFNKGICFPIVSEEQTARSRLERVLPISEFYIKKHKLAGKKVLLFVGRLVEFKNVEFAISAFAKANIKDSVFVIVGSGDQEIHLKQMSLVYENVLMVGRYEGDELYAWYNVAQIFTLPSILEPFGAVTNEALVAGCNVLISKYAGSNCLVYDGRNGYIIDPHNEYDYIEKLSMLMKNASFINCPIKLKQSATLESFEVHFDKLTKKLDSLI